MSVVVVVARFREDCADDDCDDDDDNRKASTPSARPIPWYMVSSIVRRSTAMAMSVADARTSSVEAFPKRRAHDLSEAFRASANAVDAKEDEATAYGTKMTSPRTPMT